MGLIDFLKKGEEKAAQGQPHFVPQSEKPSSTPPVEGAVNEQEYEVKSGDSLSKIASQFYGEANKWDKIYQANKDIIKDPDLIHPGQKIKIPLA